MFTTRGPKFQSMAQSKRASLNQGATETKRVHTRGALRRGGVLALALAALSTALMGTGAIAQSVHQSPVQQRQGRTV